jgi:glycosyltransferase involved in cell wall biosynthesis
MKFKIVVPTYNTENWITRCLFSIYTQAHQDWECVVINDASTDSTGKVIDSLDFVTKDPRFKIVHNEKNVKALKNIVDGFYMLNAKDEPESVLMIVDGDDFLFSEYALTIVEQAYDQTGCVLTYGNHVHHPTGGKSNCEPIPAGIVEKKLFREYKFVTSHLRTFKSKLWYMIKDEDLKDEDGTYFSAGWDVSFMMPMLEMAGRKFVFIPNVLYCYNRFNPISDDVIRQADQHRVEMKIRTAKKYDTVF